MTRKQIRKSIEQLNTELQQAVKDNNTSDTLRCLFGLGILKDMLLESYGETNASDAVSPVVTSNVNVSEYRAPDFSSPLRIVK